MWWQEAVQAPSEAVMDCARERQLTLTKPPGSLGLVESLAVAFAGWQNSSAPRVDRVEICVFAADHGVAEEGVSAFPQDVTQQMIHNFATGGAAITVLAEDLGASFRVVSLGTVAPVAPMAGLIVQQLAPGTANFCYRPAMSVELLSSALDCGAAHAPRKADLFIGGEMGIGNTTSAAALTSALLGIPPEETVGRGTGVDEAGTRLKCHVVTRALDQHLCDEPGELELLRRLGGLEIAALCGAYIAAAQRGIPSLVDGYICTAAALIACRLNRGVREWLCFAHRSAEPGHGHLLRALEALPLLDAGLCLGEGSGAAIAVPILRSACILHNNMATFAEAGVSTGEVDS